MTEKATSTFFSNFKPTMTSFPVAWHTYVTASFWKKKSNHIAVNQRQSKVVNCRRGHQIDRYIVKTDNTTILYKRLLSSVTYEFSFRKYKCRSIIFPPPVCQYIKEIFWRNGSYCFLQQYSQQLKQCLANLKSALCFHHFLPSLAVKKIKLKMCPLLLSLRWKRNHFLKNMKKKNTR